jgi:hypothetical protein
MIKIFSYLLPIKIYEIKLSKSLEVTWANGELVLDSENANYSYGSLQRILRLGLKYMDTKNSRHESNSYFELVAEVLSKHWLTK